MNEVYMYTVCTCTCVTIWSITCFLSLPVLAHIPTRVHVHLLTFTHTHMHTCIVPCDPLVIPSNGKAYFSVANGLDIRWSGNYSNATIRFSPSDATRFSCDGGFSLVGQDTVVCQTNGKWSAPPPTCAVGKWRC